MSTESILVVNAGSSSVKFQVFSISTNDELSPFLKGQIDGIGTRPHLRATSSDKSVRADEALDPTKVTDVATAMGFAGAWLREKANLKIAAVGHRVVHGGSQYDRPVLINETVFAELARLSPLAPLHQPNNLAPIRAIKEHFPDLPQVACFDTAFHREHSEVADHFAIPERFYAEGVRRYGFHGLSYEYVAERLKEISPAVALGRLIIAHLGSGASMCALSGARSVESTMGFTALDGLPMGTRPGQIDPGVLLYLIMERGMTPAAVQDMLYRESGLRGLSGVGNDMRELQSSDEPGAKLAIDYFVYRVGLHAGMLAAALGGLDAFVFTAGIGENSPDIRAKIAEKLAWLGVEFDPNANAAGEVLISKTQSKVKLYVVPTNEELMIGRHTLAVLSKGPNG